MLKIDRLSLRVTGFTGDEARRLAQRIAEELAQAPSPRHNRLESLQIQVSAQESGTVDELARQVAADVLRQIARQF